jgi:hypothetical protein
MADILSDLTKFKCSRLIFTKSQIKLQVNPFSGRRPDTYGRAVGCGHEEANRRFSQTRLQLQFVLCETHDNILTETISNCCFRQVGKIVKSDYKLRHVCLPVCPSTWNNSTLQLDGFSWNLSIFRKSVEKSQESLKSDEINRYFAWRPTYIYDDVSLNSSWNEKCFRQIL